MQLKITTDYAIRMILYLAQNESVIVSATEIAQAMKIPHSYLIQIGAVLKKSGLIQAHSGRLGGYSLAEPSDSITLYDIDPPLNFVPSEKAIACCNNISIIFYSI